MTKNLFVWFFLLLKIAIIFVKKYSCEWNAKILFRGKIEWFFGKFQNYDNNKNFTQTTSRLLQNFEICFLNQSQPP